ncbi:MAG: MYXO-CTERM sorting domain-containing protein [Minicystis sp.]
MPRLSASVLVLAAFAPLGASSHAVPARLRLDTPRRDDPGARVAWWHRQRAYPAADAPSGAWARARIPFREARKHPRDAAPIAWKPIGPAPLDTTKGAYSTPNMSPSAGRASAIAVDPTDSKIIYAGYALGGVWKSTDGGAAWTPLLDLAPTLAVGAVALDPAAPSTLYVGTGEPAPYIGYVGQGILRSTDGGQTFEKIGGAVFDGLSVGRILVDGSDLYAAAMFGAHGRGQSCNSDYDEPGQGLYRSTDGGATWTMIKAGKIIDVEIDTSVNPHRFLVSDFAAGVFWSENDGDTWTPATGLPAKIRRAELAFSPANPSVVYAGMGVSGQGVLYLSTDGGKSFNQVQGAPDYCQVQCYYDNTVAVDPTDEKTVYLGGNLCGIWKTTNATDPQPTWVNVTLPNHDCKGGTAWYDGFVHPDIHALAFDPASPSTVYAATDGGLARSVDAGDTWAQLNDGVGTLQIYALCADPQDPSAIYGGSQDTGVFMRSDTGFRVVVAADGGPCAIDPGDSKTVLASTEYGSILKTQTAFANTPSYVFETDPNECTAGEPGCGDRTSFIAPLVGDPGTKGTFYVGTYRVWKSDAAGDEESWKPISGDLTAGSMSVHCPDAKTFNVLDDTLTALAVAPSAPAVLYTGSQTGRMFTTRDGGKSWTRVDKAPLPGRWVSAIAVDPRDPAVVFASFSGFADATPGAPGHVFRSADGGDTWELRDIGTDTPVDTLIAHAVTSDLLYAGTDAGVLFTTDGGKSWSPLGDALPSVPVYSLVHHRAGNTLLAGTFGRSAWTLNLPKGTLGVVPGQLTFTAPIGGSAAAQTIQITTSDPRGGITHFTAAAGAPWASVDRASGDVAGARGEVLSVAVTPGKLAADDHDTTITITPEGGGAPLQVPLRLTITEATEPVVTDGGCGCRVGSARGETSTRALLAIAAIVALRARRKRLS